MGNDTDHVFDLAGIDNGTTPIGNNYGWRLLNITNQDIYLNDSDLTNSTGFGDGALYVKVLTGANVSLGPNVVNNIFGDPDDEVNIYYDEHPGG